MDRNFDAVQIVVVIVVALRKESVDRNTSRHCMACMILMSLSARRAWIEIVSNSNMLCNAASLSARRAWIEIIKKGRARRPGQVALRKESVDRNAGGVVGIIGRLRRSPQGERG